MWGIVDGDRISWLYDDAELEKRARIYTTPLKTTVGANVTKEEYLEITRVAELLGMSRSSFCRKAVLEAVEKAKSKMKI